MRFRAEHKQAVALRAAAWLTIGALLPTLTACTGSMAHAPERYAKVAVVVAHPDDETAFGGAVARSAREAEVHLIIATDGRYGVSPHAGIPAGDSLVSVRAEEARCSAGHLGVAELHLLGAADGLGTREGTSEYFRQTRKLREDLRSLLESLEPDVIVTFGPDGDTGHADHRIISALVTELRFQGTPSISPDLLYLAWTREQATLWEDLEVGYVDDAYIDTIVPFSAEDEERSIEAIRCHRSQLSEEEMDEWIAVERSDTTNARSFRKVEPGPVARRSEQR